MTLSKTDKAARSRVKYGRWGWDAERERDALRRADDAAFFRIEEAAARSPEFEALLAGKVCFWPRAQAAGGPMTADERAALLAVFDVEMGSGKDLIKRRWRTVVAQLREGNMSDAFANALAEMIDAGVFVAAVEITPASKIEARELHRLHDLYLQLRKDLSDKDLHGEVYKGSNTGRAAAAIAHHFEVSDMTPEAFAQKIESSKRRADKRRHQWWAIYAGLIAGE